MNRRICDHKWLYIGGYCFECGDAWWCPECGTVKLDDCGTIRYRYIKRERPNIYSAARKNGNKARRKK